MWFLIKAAFWFSVVLVMLPFFDNEAGSKLQTAPQVEATDAIMAAAGAVNYMTKICADRPLVCEKGGETLNALGFRAKEGALVAYKLIDKNFADKPADEPTQGRVEADPITTAAIIPVPAERPTDTN